MFSHRRAILVIGDAVMFGLSFLIMTLIRFDTTAQSDVILTQIQLFSILFFLWLIVFFIFDLYSPRRINPNPRTIGLLLAAMATNTLLSIVFFYIVPATGVNPKTNLAIITITSFLLSLSWRRLFYILFTKRFKKSILLLGTNPLLFDLRQELHNHPHAGIVVAHLHTIPEALFDEHIDVIIADGTEPQALLSFARSVDAEILSLAEAYESLLAKLPLELMSDERALHYLSRPHNPGIHFLYRVLEIVFAVTVLISTSPLILLAILARLIEDGTPVFYTQKRVGKNGKLFSVYKLRSMKKDAEKDGVQWATANDARITWLGTILRTTHLDEVPQMLNIIKGDIALVGPRPERPEFVSELEAVIPYYFLRHSIRPGFTGWAQIKYRYARSVDDQKEKFEYDLYYIKNRHPLLDTGIVLKTLQIIFTH